MDQVLWNKKALDTTRKLPDGIKKEIGLLIQRLQFGQVLKMPFSRSMPSLGNGCYELRVKDENGNFRVFYYLKLKGFIIIFHVFQKKSEKTLKRELEIAKKNLKELLNEKK